MKALIVKEKGRLDLVDDLEKPTAGPGEILIRVKAASLNPYDLESTAGHYDAYFEEYGVTEPVRTGLEYAGVVESDGERLKKGDRVYGYTHLITGWKAHAEFICLPESYVARMPHGLSFDQAAGMPLGMQTSLVALQDLGALTKDGRILIFGASGGIGVYAVQLAKLMGHQVTAVAATDRHQDLKELGADALLDYRNLDWEGLAGRFDLVLDFSTFYSLKDCRPLLAEGGKFVPALPDDNNGGTSESPEVGYLMVEHGDGARIEAMEDAITKGRIRPVIDRAFAFEDHEAALTHLQQKGKLGRVVLTLA